MRTLIQLKTSGVAVVLMVAVLGCKPQAEKPVQKIEVVDWPDAFPSGEVKFALLALDGEGKPTRGEGEVVLELVESRKNPSNGQFPSVGSDESLGCASDTVSVGAADFGTKSQPAPASLTIPFSADGCRPPRKGYTPFFRLTWNDFRHPGYAGLKSRQPAIGIDLAAEEEVTPSADDGDESSAVAGVAESPDDASKGADSASGSADRWPGETPGPVPALLPDADWRSWRAPDGSVAADMPAAPRRAPMGRDAFAWEGISKQVSCTLVHYPVTGNRSLSDYAASHRRQAVESPEGKVVSERSVRAGQLEGREMVVLEVDRGQRFEIVERLFVHEGRVYVAQAAYPVKRPEKPRCVETFEVVSKGR